jgi:predicted permease
MKRLVPPSVEREVDEEFSFHVDMRVRELVGRGWTEDDARAEAIRRFGDMDRVKADCRDLGAGRNVRMNRQVWRDEIRQDFRYAVRQLRRAPSFAAIAILTLGIAVGANTAVFSVVNGVLLKPLPYPEPDQLAVLWTRYLPPSGFDIPKFALSGPEFLDYRESTEAFGSLGAYATGTRSLTGEGVDAERVGVALYTVDVLPALGVRPRLGRAFTHRDDAAGGPPVTILGHDLWVGRFGADPAVVGRSILMNGLATEVVGVMPEGFAFPSDTQAWLPLGLDRTNAGGRGGHGTRAVGRLAPGGTMADVHAELAVLRERWAQEFEHNEAHFLWAQDLRTELVGDAPGRLRLLMAAVGLVLLVACANLTNLLLARAERRHVEIAVRTTLGAGRGRIARQLVTESLVLAAVASILGLALALAGTRALIAMDPEALPRLEEVGLDETVLLFTVGAALLSALLFGIAPAYLAGRRGAPSVASSESRAVGARRGSALRRLLVTSEVALSLVVVILAGLVVRSFAALTSTDPRMNADDLLTFSLTLPAATYPDDDLVPSRYEELLERTRAVPSVVAATAASALPFGGLSQWDFQLDDRPPRRGGEVAWNAGITHVATDYFETLGIPVLEGRALTRGDGRDAPLVAVASESMAARYWPGESVIGKRFGYAMQDESTGTTVVPWITIVGLVPDPVTSSVDQAPYPHVYVPQAQAGVSTYGVPRSLRIAVRSGIEAGSLLPGVRAAVADLDRNLPLSEVTTMETVVAESLSGPRIMANLLGTFAAIALVLAVVGIYGVISYSVAGRTREIGVRVALGAEGGTITRMILLEGAGPVVAGIVIGLAGAWLASRLVESMLFGVEPTDPATFALLPLAVLAVGMLASLIPALRATRVAPTEALREG